MGILNLFKNNQKSNDFNNSTLSLKEINEFFSNQNFNADISNDRLNSATYFACMQIRCNAIAKLPLKIYRETGKGKEKAKDYYLYNLLKKRPNPYMTMHDFLFATEFQRLETGDAFIYQDVKKGKIQGLYLLNSNQVTIYVDRAGIIDKENAIWYSYRDNQGKEYKLNYKEVVHLKNFSLDGIKGTPIKKYLTETIENEQYANKFLNNHYKNGLAGSAVINYEGDLSADKVTKVRQKFEQMTSGIKNAGRIIPMPFGFSLSQLQRKLVEEDFFKLQGLTIRHIANSFGVKLFQLNDLERSTYGNVETQNISFYSDTLQNVLTHYEQELDYKLLTVDDNKRGYYTKFNVDAILRGDFKTRMEGYQIAVNNMIMTPAEVREKEDLKFLEGSDRLIGNGNLIPIELIGIQYMKGGEQNLNNKAKQKARERPKNKSNKITEEQKIKIAKAQLELL